MDQIELTITTGYVSNWTTADALRELVANAVDGQERGRSNGTGQMEFGLKDGNLTILNRNTVIPVEAWLHGFSGSRGLDSTIGQFGEGLPNACMVLSRNGHRIEIYNGDQKWTPQIGRSATFDAELLIIPRRKVKHRNDYTVIISDVSEALWEEVKGRFLALDPEYDPEWTIRCSQWNRSKILLDDRYKGRIYCKGVYVQSREDISFGYDLDVELNRDRSIIEEWSLKYKLADALQDAVTNEPGRFRETVLPSFFSSTELVANDEYSCLTRTQVFKDMVLEEWATRYGCAYAVRDAETVELASRIGLRGIIVSPVVRQIIEEAKGSVAQMKERQELEVASYEDNHLTPVEHRRWDAALRVVKLVIPTLDLTQVRIVLFKGATTKYSDEDDQYLVARSMLESQSLAYRAAAHVGVMASGRTGYDAEIDILSSMLEEQAKMVQPEPIIDLPTLRRLLNQVEV